MLALTEPNERHEVRAKSDARLVLVLAPWPGEGHPSADGTAREQRAARLLYDIHGNLPALEAVIDGRARRRAQTSSSSAATTRSRARGRRRA